MVSLTRFVYTFSNTRGATLSLFVFIPTQMNVYTNVGSRTSTTTTSSIWSYSPTISSRHILFCIRINSWYSVVLYLRWNLCNNHPFLGDTVFLQFEYVCNAGILCLEKITQDVTEKIVPLPHLKDPPAHPKFNFTCSCNNSTDITDWSSPSCTNCVSTWVFLCVGLYLHSLGLFISY